MVDSCFAFGLRERFLNAAARARGESEIDHPGEGRPVAQVVDDVVGSLFQSGGQRLNSFPGFPSVSSFPGRRRP